MTSSNYDTNCGTTNSNCGATTSNYGTNASNNSTTATCTEVACGTTCDINQVTSPGCYWCSWNGALLRVPEDCFSSNGNTSFDYTCNSPMTVTFLTDNWNATTEECRSLANSVNCRCNF